MAVDVQVTHLSKAFRSYFGGQRQVVHAVQDVSLTIPPGSTLGIVGESGSGKSTLARCILGLLPLTGGDVKVDGESIPTLSRRRWRHWRPRMQLVFQDPYDSLNPRMRIRALLQEPYVVHSRASGPALEDKVRGLLADVHLGAELLDRFPHQLSGGQLQRVGIARAIALHPDLLVLDEPTSAVDVSTRVSLLRLLKELQRRHDMTYLLISHDVDVVSAFCDNAAVMYLGRVVEHGSADDVRRRPQHPYTRLLLSSSLSLDPKAARDAHALPTVESDLDWVNPQGGCPFKNRCVAARSYCDSDVPPLFEALPGSWAACWRVGDGTLDETSWKER